MVRASICAHVEALTVNRLHATAQASILWKAIQPAPDQE